MTERKALLGVKLEDPFDRSLCSNEVARLAEDRSITSVSFRFHYGMKDIQNVATR